MKHTTKPALSRLRIATPMSKVSILGGGSGDASEAVCEAILEDLADAGVHDLDQLAQWRTREALKRWKAEREALV